jgi:hypothetical protein
MEKSMIKLRTICVIILCLVLFAAFSTAVFAKNEKVATPKEHGAYIKTSKGLVRLLPNIVFDEDGVVFVESNNPAHFFLKDVPFFGRYGKYEMNVLTVNPMGFYQPSALGKPRFAFGKDIEIDVRPQGKDMYIIKPKGLLGRGYYSIWINDTAWDFMLD